MIFSRRILCTSAGRRIRMSIVCVYERIKKHERKLCRENRV